MKMLSLDGFIHHASRVIIMLLENILVVSVVKGVFLVIGWKEAAAVE